MDSVKVKKDDLLTKLKENRIKHKSEYDEAVVKHRAEAIDALEKRRTEIVDGAKVDLTFKLPTPVEYLATFDQAIEMLEWEQDDTIELDELDFKRFVLNKWEWARQFEASTTMYNARG